MHKCILGFAGEIASGKGTATELVKSWYPQTPSFRFSDPLREFYRLLLEHFPALARGHTPETFGIGAVSLAGSMLKRSLGFDPVSSMTHFNGFHEFTLWLFWKFIPEHKGPWPERASTADLQSLSTAMRFYFGEDTLERSIIAPATLATPLSPIVLIDGIRRLVDIGRFMQLSSPVFRLVYVEADPRVRYARFIARNEKPGDKDLSFEQFQVLGQAEAETQIRALRSQAHLIIDNSGPQTRLETVLSNAVGEWIT